MNYLENNKLIAEFMGLTLGYPDPNENRWADDWFNPTTMERIGKHLNYETSWNRLMPVVRKIVEICLSDEEIDGAFESDQYTSILETVPLAVIEDSWKVVVEFIQWYNTQEKV